MAAQKEAQVEKAYQLAREVYESWGVDTEKALKQLDSVAISIHCWQGDDVAGLESGEDKLDSGGLKATGNYPGRARTGDELRSDLLFALKLVPGSRKKVNIHAFYAEAGGKKVERNQLEVEHFSSWIDWALENGFALDFNPTFFAHPLAEDGYTLSSKDRAVRQFWIEHGICARRIARAIGERQKQVCTNNLWIPDGEKDTPVDRWGPRMRLVESLDEILKEDLPREAVHDTFESKLFGIGSESYVVGSHEFYLSYCVSRGVSPCLDLGHFHPTESVADKISSILLFTDALLLHISRGVRWDSDHVVILSDEVSAVCEEVVRGKALERTFFALDYFDASINRIAAWVIGARSLQKALLRALLQPTEKLMELEQNGDRTSRLAYLEELKTLPFGAVWDYFCLTSSVPVQRNWLDSVKAYEKQVLSKRG